jgi:hypothetical protein
MKKWMMVFLSLGLCLIIGCNQTEKLAKVDGQTEELVEKESKYEKRHPYGGWLCPDNFGMFPPVDIEGLDEVPVVEGRLPTEEEARNGHSLMHIDTSIYKDARPLDMALPRLARIHSHHNDMDELIIVIQAVVIGEDSIVGYRFPSGGNGSAWLGQVTFLDEDETDQMGSLPYVYIKEEIKASTIDIWKAFSSTEYAQGLGKKFDKKDFFNQDWTIESRANLSYEKDGERASGVIMNMFGSLYGQIDYEKDGFHFTEKLLIMQDYDTGHSEMHIVFGPYTEGYEEKKKEWMAWVKDVKERSEG